MWFLGLIPGLFNTVNGITNAIANERLKLISATTDRQKIAAEERITSLQAKRDVLVAESGRSNVNAFLRGCIGASAAVLIAKLLIWDKVIGSFYYCAGPAGQNKLGCETFRTDIVDPNQWAVVMAVVGFYFLYEGAVNVSRIIKS